MGIAIAQLVISFLGFGGAIVALVFGLRQYRRAEQWRRGEFVAKEIKDFQCQLAVRNVLLIVDWARRRINLAQEASTQERDWPLITRAVLWRALLPHPIKDLAPGALDHETDARAEDGEGRTGTFTKTELLLRDSFDSFLDGLERFANFVESSLVTADEFRPYLRYWIDDLATDQGDADDARFRCVLLTYIHFYRFEGVVQVFSAFGHNISPDGPLYRKLRARMKDEKLYSELMRVVSAGLYGAGAVSLPSGYAPLVAESEASKSV